MTMTRWARHTALALATILTLVVAGGTTANAAETHPTTVTVDYDTRQGPARAHVWLYPDGPDCTDTTTAGDPLTFTLPTGTGASDETHTVTIADRLCVAYEAGWTGDIDDDDVVFYAVDLARNCLEVLTDGDSHGEYGECADRPSVRFARLETHAVPPGTTTPSTTTSTTTSTTAPATTTTTVAAPGPELPATGAATDTLTRIAAALIALGALTLAFLGARHRMIRRSLDTAVLFARVAIDDLGRLNPADDSTHDLCRDLIARWAILSRQADEAARSGNYRRMQDITEDLTILAANADHLVWHHAHKETGR